jgi:acylphosphatase
MYRYTVHFVGRVQGVGFRYTTRNTASGFNVSGYVRNLRDGRVQMVAEGQRPELDAFVAAVCQRMARCVNGHEVVESAATGEFGPPGTFDVR